MGAKRTQCQLTMERVAGIEPAFSAWEAEVLPLNYTRAYESGRTTVHLMRLS